ncbi:hypothetical protein OBBRIDRAFT_136466 [Obba rivulosa]|uniref:Uncharacterized protein n=1 Tax=Obba rivulosa TaxID=1052685 RepID=A0A8E2AYG2_9APHY|nr:hypothetical protein OBBRIDRAFT_136466 [Obba rivulosa]
MCTLALVQRFWDSREVSLSLISRRSQRACTYSRVCLLLVIAPKDCELNPVDIIDSLHALHRLGRSSNLTEVNYVKSICGNREFDQFTIEQAIDEIWSKRKVEHLVSLMNPPHSGVPDGEHCRCYCKVNFLSYFDKGTIEFRQHEGTVEQDTIFSWVQFVLAFVRNTVNLSDTNVKKLQPTVEDLLSLVGKTTFQAIQRRRIVMGRTMSKWPQFAFANVLAAF